MAQAVIHIQLDPEQVNQIAEAVAARLQQGQQAVTSQVTQSNPPPVDSQATWSAGNTQDQSGFPQNGQAPAPDWPAPSQNSAPAPAPPSAPTASPSPNGVAGPPQCRHGQMRFVQAGVAKSGPRAGQSYPPFYACPADRNAPDKCKSVPVQ